MSRSQNLSFEITAENNFSNTFKKLGNEVVSVASKFRSLRLSVANIKTIVASAIGGYFMKSIIDSGDSLAKLNTKLAISTEALSQYKYVAEACGLSFTNLTSSLTKMNTRIAEAVFGQGEAINVLKELGIEAKAFSTLKPEEQFEVLADRMLLVKNNADKLRIATKLFEEEGQGVLQVVAKGSKGIRELRLEAHSLGLTLSKEDTNAMASFNEALTRLNNSFRGLVQTLLPKIAPAMVKFMDLIRINFINSFDLMINKIQEFINSFEALLKFFSNSEKPFVSLVKSLQKLDTELEFIFKGTIATVMSNSLTKLGKTFNELHSITNLFSKDSSVNEYFNNKGTILSKTNEGLDEYLSNLYKIKQTKLANLNTNKSTVGYSNSLMNSKASTIKPVSFPTTQFDNIYQQSNAKTNSQLKEENKLLGLKEQVLNDLQTPFDTYLQKLQILGQLTDNNLLTQQQYNSAFEKYLDDFKKTDNLLTFQEMIQNISNETSNLATVMQTTMSKAIDGIAQEITNLLTTGKADFAQLAVALANMVTQMTIKLMLLKTLTTALGMPALPLGFAKGGVFQNGQLTTFARGGLFTKGKQLSTFAKGGLVNSPTYFPMNNNKLGLMGEKGAEAILPLTRGANGKLGVKMYGNGMNNNNANHNPYQVNNIYFNVNSNNPEEFRRSQAEIERDLILSLERGKRNG